MTTLQATEPERAFQIRLLRHVVFFVAFFFAWRFLDKWYVYWQRADYIKFAILFGLAIIVGPANITVRWLRRSSTRRLIFFSIVLLLAIPWGEFVQHTRVANRENWSEEILIAVAFIYACLVFLRAAPSIAEFLQGGADAVIRTFEARPLLFWLAPFAFFCFSSWIALHVYQEIPLTQDTASHLFQARIFAHGRLSASMPQAPDFFSISGDMIVAKENRWFSMYLPGYALGLSLFVLLHIQWLFSPLLGAATLAIWISYARRWHGNQIAVIFSFLLLFSPFVFLMHSTIMVHSQELFLASAVIYLARKETEEPSRTRMVLVFVALVLGMITRGFSLIPFLLPVIGYLIYNKIRRKQLVDAFLVFAGLVAGVALLAFYQWKTTGNPLLPAYNLEAKHAYGLGTQIAGRLLTGWNALENISNEILGLNSWLSGWYSGSLFFVLLFILFGTLDQWDALLLLGCVILFGFYFFYPVQDLIFGPRFYLSTAPVFLLFVARTSFLPAFRNANISTFLVALLIVSFLTFLPFRLWDFVHRYDPAGSELSSLKEEIREQKGRRVIIFLDPDVDQYLINWNDPFFENGVVISRDLGARNVELIRKFPGFHPRYFRTDVRKGTGTGLSNAFAGFDQPAKYPVGYVSLLQIALRMEAAHGDRDAFDFAYNTMFHANISRSRLDYLQKMLASPQEKPQYKEYFRQAMIHSARMFLLPKAAYEENEEEWQKYFSVDEFMNELRASMNAFRASGEVGKIMIERLTVISKRIDTNGDEISTPEEVRVFVAKKLEEL